MPDKQRLTLASSARYELRIQAALDASWKDNLNAVTLEVENCAGEPPVTRLICVFVDQAALRGALSYIYAMGLPLLSVTCIDIEPDNPS